MWQSVCPQAFSYKRSFDMRIVAQLLVSVLASAAFSGYALAEDLAQQTRSLPRSTPESQRTSTAGIRSFIEAADQNVDSMHSFMLVRNGYVVAEAWWKPEAADKPHVLWSLSKSFTSTAVGLAVAEGKLSIDDRVLSFFPDDAPENPSKNLQAMRVRDLLTMTAGHQKEVRLREAKHWVRAFLESPGSPQTGNPFSIQHAGNVHAFGNCSESDGPNSSGLFAAEAL